MVAIKEQLFCRQGDTVYVKDLLEEKRGQPSTSVQAAPPGPDRDVPSPSTSGGAGGPLEALRRSNRDAFQRRHEDLLRYLEDITSNAGQVQDQLLTGILSTNSGAHYLHRFGLNGRTDLDAFTALPVVQYKDVEADIHRVVIDGDKAPVLSVPPPVEVLVSSATSGGGWKLFPAVEGDAERRALAESLVRALLHRDVAGLDQGKCLYFFCSRGAVPLPSGLLAKSVLTSDYQHASFRFRPFDPSFQLTSPDEVILSTDALQALYCHWLLGLVQAEQVLRIGAVFASNLVKAITYLEEVWQELCQDIATGSVGARITDPVLRDVCQEFVNKPDPHLAAKVRAACDGGGIGAGIIPRLFPNIKLIDVVTTGSMEAYIPSLQLYGGGVQLVCGQLYGASECYMGVNVEPLSPPDAVSYTLLPNLAYFEFLPRTQATTEGPLEQHKLVALVDVEVGHEYELVVTTYAGLYRFRTGDILRCTGHYNQAPQFYFVERVGVALSVATEKTTEQDLRHAVTQASQHLQAAAGMLLRDYTSYCDMSSMPGHYVIFWEVAGNDSDLGSHVLDQCCSTIEKNFNNQYHLLRKEGNVGPLELRIVPRGTFDKLASLAIAEGSTLAQYKTPRCLKQQPMVDLMNASVCCSHFSSFMPEPQRSVLPGKSTDQV